ncbi:MAG: hypothetical protein JNK72_23525 [Myxococcales bacterium]|nr:hypothetical protein [Myxococcales bacterium]
MKRLALRTPPWPALALAALASGAGANAQARAGVEAETPWRPFSFVMGGLSTSSVLRADSICPSAATVCPLGGGGGIYVAYGRRYRANREWAAGYDLSVRNARNLFASATLQQARFDYRWVAWSPRSNLEGFLGVGAGLAFYGETFTVTTFGPLLNVSAGAHYNLSAFFSIGLLVRVEALRFLVPFDSGDGVTRSDGGIASVLATSYLTATWRGP